MKPLRVGLDIGSTTVKAVVLDQEDFARTRAVLRLSPSSRQCARPPWPDCWRTSTPHWWGRVAVTSRFGCHHRFRRSGARRQPARTVHPGGHRRDRGDRRRIPAGRRHHRVGRRGRQDHLSQADAGTAYERLLRGRYRRVHRPDVHVAGHRRRRPQRDGQALHHAVSDRIPLRRVRQNRPAAADQRRRRQAGSGGLHLQPPSPPRPSPVWRPAVRSTAPSSSWAARCFSCPSCARRSIGRSKARSTNSSCRPTPICTWRSARLCWPGSRRSSTPSNTSRPAPAPTSWRVWTNSNTCRSTPRRCPRCSDRSGPRGLQRPAPP